MAKVTDIVFDLTTDVRAVREACEKVRREAEWIVAQIDAWEPRKQSFPPIAIAQRKMLDSARTADRLLFSIDGVLRGFGRNPWAANEGGE